MRRPSIRPRLELIAVLATAVATCGCSGETQESAEPTADSGPPGFVDVTAESGIHHVHSAGLEGRYAMREAFAPGVALFDYDGDGDLDLYLTDNGPNRLLRREADGTYRDVTEASGLGDPGYGMGVAVGDVDNDGDLDVYVANFGSDRFYRNAGDGTFEDATAGAGIADDGWSTSVAFCDLDADGHLDLFVTRYVQYDPSRSCTDDVGRPEYCGPAVFRGTPDRLYINRGDGRFLDASAASGIASKLGKGLGVVCADLDNDGREDVYVANDGEPNFLWSNLGGRRFEDRAVLMGTAVNAFGKPEASMGIALGDVDGDLRLDLFLTHLARESNTLYTRTGEASFVDATATAGVGPSGMPYTGFGTGFLDVDLDGDLDLFVVNGRVERGGAAPRTGGSLHERFVADYGEPNLLYLNDGTGRLQPADARLAGDLAAGKEVSRGAAFGDVDDDGDLDIVVTNGDGPVRLYRNDLQRRGRWLRVRAIDPGTGRDAVGSLLVLRAGARSWLRPVTHSTSYLSSSDAEAHFGLGDTAAYDRIDVRWPDGTFERFAGGPTDRAIRVTKGGGERIAPGSAG